MQYCCPFLGTCVSPLVFATFLRILEYNYYIQMANYIAECIQIAQHPGGMVDLHPLIEDMHIHNEFTLQLYTSMVTRWKPLGEYIIGTAKD